MKELASHLLEFDKALPYFTEQLTNVNMLSGKILENIDFNKGSFFSLLSTEADTKKCYDFRYGGILPLQPVIRYQDKEKVGAYSHLPNIDIEVGNFILQILKNNPNSFCIFDDVIQSRNDSHIELFHECGLSYHNELYYLINQSNCHIDLIISCLKQSKAIWHSLCVISSAGLAKSTDRSIKKTEMVNFAKNAQMVLLGAYDGEGFVFWEKTF